MKGKFKKIKEAILFILAVSIILSCFTLLPAGVSYASPLTGYANISVYIDYLNETIVLSGKDTDDPVKYMYSPNATATTLAKKLAAEKWYPIYGDTINISQFIPKNESVEILFAFRDADELPNSDGIYSSRVLSNKKGQFIKGRPNITQTTFRNSVRYDPQSETIRISGDLLSGYDYQVGNGNWIADNKNTSIDVSSKYNALGGTLAIRKSAGNMSFVSNEYKIKIPKAPNTPKVRVNESTCKIIGIVTGNNGQAWSLTEDGTYTLFNERTVDLAEFEKQMGKSLSEFEEESTELTSGEANNVNIKEDYVILYIKVPATEKRPSSPVQKLYIKKTLIEKSLRL